MSAARQVKILTDGWTAVTRDSRSPRSSSTRSASPRPAYEIFTLSPTGLHKPPFETATTSAEKVSA